MKQTALYSQHVALDAKMVPFAGFIMPIQYSGIIDEHLAVRRNVGVFDVSHMGEFEIRGSDAEAWLNRMTTNNVTRLEPGRVQYSAMLCEDGGVVDDLLVYRFEDKYMTVVNAANIEKDYNWLKNHLEGDVQLKDTSDEITLLAVQGPRAVELVAGIADERVDDIPYYNFREGGIRGTRAVISRTGYTGEDGFELYVERAHSVALWNSLWDAGKAFDLKPAGLGARDSLRLEVAYCLYGNDIDQTTNPIEAGLGWIVKSKKRGGFIGLEPVRKAKERTSRRLVGFTINGRGIARHHDRVMLNDGKIGEITSGGYSPILEKGIGLAYIDKPYDQAEQQIEIDVRGRRISALVVPTPFYKRES